MALLLCIDTATSVCSVGISSDGDIISIRESDQKNAHSSLIIPFIEEVCSDAGIEIKNIDAVAVSKGPGSYTGLRIGVSTAKGLCFAMDKPLVAISTLRSMAKGMSLKIIDKESRIPVLFCPMIDARRMEVYAGIYDRDINEIRKIQAEIIDDNSYQNFLEKYFFVYGGDGAEKCKPFLEKHKNAYFLDDFHPSVTYMAPIVEQRFNEKLFVDLAYFEPFYLKDFIAGIPKVKGLR